MQPKKNESHMQIGGPVCVVSEEPKRPSTCPSPSTYDILYCGAGNDVITRARQVEEAKMRAFQGNHIFDFNDEPRNEAEDEEHFSISKIARRRDIRGNDIFGEGRRDNPWSLRPAAPCGKRHIGPCSQKSFAVDPQALRVNDSARYLTTCEPNSCNGKRIPTFGSAIDMIVIWCSMFLSKSETSSLALHELGNFFQGKISLLHDLCFALNGTKERLQLCCELCDLLTG